MSEKKTIRRNTLVRCIWNPAFAGRVVRTLEDGALLWITFSGHLMIHWPEALRTDDYPVWSRRGKIVPEMSLRNFKRKAAKFHGALAYNTPLDHEYIFDGRKQFTRDETKRFRELEDRRKLDAL